MIPPTLSVILPNYNHARYLPAALDALLHQTRPPVEILVIDDASSDNSVEIISEFADRHPSVRLLRNERNMGVLATLNRGLQLAVGDFVYPAAADDVVIQGFFEKALTLLANNPSARVCAVDLAQFDPDSGRTRYLRPQPCSSPGFVPPEAMPSIMKRRRVVMYGGMALVQRSAAISVGGYVPELKWYADWFQLFVLAFRYGICYQPEVLATMRMLPGAYAATGRRDPAVQDALHAKILDLLKSPEYSDIYPAIRDSGALCLLGSALFRVLKKPAYRDFVTPWLLTRLLWNIPVTATGLNPASPSPLIPLDRSVRGILRLDGTIQSHGIHIDD